MGDQSRNLEECHIASPLALTVNGVSQAALMVIKITCSKRSAQAVQVILAIHHMSMHIFSSGGDQERNSRGAANDTEGMRSGGEFGGQKNPTDTATFHGC